MHLAVGGAGHGVECQRKAVFGVDWPQGAIQRRIGGVIAVRLFVVAVATNRLHFLLSCAHSDSELPFCLCGLAAVAPIPGWGPISACWRSRAGGHPVATPE